MHRDDFTPSAGKLRCLSGDLPGIKRRYIRTASEKACIHWSYLNVGLCGPKELTGIQNATRIMGPLDGTRASKAASSASLLTVA
jgi:hypothetical protein